jgi:hypothetical protein
MATLSVNRGTTFPIELNYKKDGVAFSLVGATVRFTVKTLEFDADSADTAALIKKNVTDGTALGTVTITLNPVDTATIAPGKYYYDIKVQEAGGAIYKVDEGRFALDGSPTNRTA